MRNHASAVLACDFLVAVTASFRVFYVFVVLDVGTRRILHWNVTDHPTAAWTAQQFRMVVAGDQPVPRQYSDCGANHPRGGHPAPERRRIVFRDVDHDGDPRLQLIV